MAFTANGSAVTFGGSALDARSIRYTKGGAEIDITALDSNRIEREVGLPDFAIEVDVRGYVPDGTVDLGDTGDIVYTPQGASAITVADCMCMSKDAPAEVDGALITTLVFKPTEEVA